MPGSRFFRENQPSKFTEILYWILIIILIANGISNVSHHEVTHPLALIIMIIGFVFFLVSKISVLAKKKSISFGTGSMSLRMTNLYRLGYWLMIFGFLTTFAL